MAAVRERNEKKAARPRARKIHKELTELPFGGRISKEVYKLILDTPPDRSGRLNGWPFGAIRGKSVARGRVATLLISSEGLGPVPLASLLVIHQDSLPLNETRA
jgi:hypothetical protein